MRPSKAVRYISIHAPREGRDEVYGVRWLALEHAFQSTRPARGATETPSTEFPTQSKFQSTRPARGATRTVSTARKSLQTFQSTRPARGATTRFSQPSDSSLHFNPRAPRGARRARYQRRGSLCRHFNPRAPRGARPRDSLNRQIRVCISIHAPREGRDPCSSQPVHRYWHFNPRAPRGARPFGQTSCKDAELFQSTRPARGATK